MKREILVGFVNFVSPALCIRIVEIDEEVLRELNSQNLEFASESFLDIIAKDIRWMAFLEECPCFVWQKGKENEFQPLCWVKPPSSKTLPQIPSL